jgi:hypothetical protein
LDLAMRSPLEVPLERRGFRSVPSKMADNAGYSTPPRAGQHDP